MLKWCARISQPGIKLSVWAFSQKKKKTTVWYGDTHTQVNHLCTLQKAPGLKLTKPLSPFGQNRRPSYPQMTQEFVSVCLRGCRITKHTLSTPLCSVTVTVCTFFLYRRNDITESSSRLDGDAGKTGCLGESSDPERKRRWKGRTNKNRGKCCSPPLCLIPHQSALTVCSSASPSPPSPTPYCVESGLHNPLQSEITQHTTTDDTFAFKATKTQTGCMSSVKHS